MVNPDDYGWFVRIALHPISIRTLNRDKVQVYHRQVVFHLKKYLGNMPGFSPVLGFNPQDPAQRALIRVGPPPELQTIEISNFISDEQLEADAAAEEEDNSTAVEYTEVNLSQEHGLHTPINKPVRVETPPAPEEEKAEVESQEPAQESAPEADPIKNDDVLNELNDIELSQVLAKARQLVLEERKQKQAAIEAAAKVAEEKKAQEEAARKKAELKAAREAELKRLEAEKKAKEEAELEIEEVEEEVTPINDNSQLNIVKEKLSSFDNRKWATLSKKDACDYLEEAGVDHSHIDDSKWEKINFLKKLVQE